MKKWRIEYKKKYTPTPLSFWVHRNLDDNIWLKATKFDPPLPKGIPCKGFPMLVVNALGVELEFSSVEEAEHFLEVIRKKNMPNSMQLSNARNTRCGPNSHWLSRLPSSLKSWVKREKIITIIERGINELKSVYS